jgi:poly(beta-D-mannuronate) lyase
MAGDTTLSNPANGIALGEEWSYEIDLSGDQLRITIWHDGKVYTTSDSIDLTKQNNGLMRRSADSSAITIDSYFDNDWMYFKAGLYNQNNSGVQNPAYSEVTFSQIDVEHY